MRETDGKPDLSALWPLLPPWIEWVAMDRDGAWCGFKKKPKVIFGDTWGYLNDMSIFYEIPVETHDPEWHP